VQTLDECKMSEYIPDSTSDGLREILLGCLDYTPRKLFLVIILELHRWSSTLTKALCCYL